MARICVIGGSGFIGSYLMRQLTARHTIINIDKKSYCNNSNVTHIQADIRDYQHLKDVFPEDVDQVVLLAAEHADDVFPTSLYYDVNVEGTNNVIRVMTEKNIHNIVFSSSVAVYGLNKHKPDEFSPTDPFNHYGKSKLEAENILRRWFENDQNGKSLIIVRPTVIFGPGNRGNVYNLLKQISSGRFMMVGKGNNRKSMAYVENVAAFISHCLESDYKKFHLFNYIDKPDLSTKELVSQAEIAIGKRILPIKIPYWTGYVLAKSLDIVLGLVKKKNPISAVRVKKFCATTQFDSATIQATGFKPLYSLEKGLEITLKSIIDEKYELDAKLTPAAIQA